MNAGVLGMIENEQTYLHRISDSLIFEVLPVEGNKSTAIVDFDFRSEIKRNICQGEKMKTDLIVVLGMHRSGNA